MSQTHGYIAHDMVSDPGRWSADVDRLPPAVADLVACVQGLLIHDFYGGLLYAEKPVNFETASRQTLPVEDRLTAIRKIEPASFQCSRRPRDRSVGTCRDYAVLLCGFLRQHKIPARVRCGFAGYFNSAGYEDHWICEYWDATDARWVMVDAQLDSAHRTALTVGFDPLDMPDDQFITSGIAWNRIQVHPAEANLFGHGDSTGLWFVLVNLVRDYLALRGDVTSGWDGWRSFPDSFKTIDDDTVTIAEKIARAGQSGVLRPEDAAIERFISSAPR